MTSPRVYASWARTEWRRVRHVAALRKSAGLPGFDVAECRARKRSDTLFVLGSGASVGRLTPADFDAIAAADSIGLNFWLLHDFVPDFYQFEVAVEPHRREMFNATLTRKAADYAQVLFLYKDIETHQQDLGAIPREVAANLRVINKVHLPLREAAMMRTVLTWWQRLSLMQRTGLPLFGRASLSLAVSFGIMTGYDKIVLVGVDLNDYRYFWDDDPRHAGFYADRPAGLHSSVTTDAGLVPIDELLIAMNEIMLRPRGMQLYAGHATSALHPRLPAWFG
jgi:hypothetical protein